MLTLLKNITCYSPQYLGKKDILIACGKISKILPPNQTESILIDAVIPCDGLLAFPGLVDGHVHIDGGGGENGFSSRIAEISPSDITGAGVTTVVGVLGADSVTRSLASLLAKARALDEQGLTAYIYTGSYAVPPVTLTGSVTEDIVLIDKIIGTGEIAISDHRSSAPTIDELARLASQTRMGGLTGKKAGVVHIHVGEGKEGLKPLIYLLDRTELPADMFVPTHVNRTRRLFCEAVQYCADGGSIDLTAGEQSGISVPEAVKMLLEANSDMSRVTVSSDANGSAPGGGVGKISALYDDIRRCVTEMKIPVETAFRLVTENPARVLKLPEKGTLSEGGDADLIITDINYNIKKTFCRGRQMNER